MGKSQKNWAIDQVMDELNEELTSSLSVSEDMFSSDLAVRPGLNQNSEGLKELKPLPPSSKNSELDEEEEEIDNLLSFEPNRKRTKEHKKSSSAHRKQNKKSDQKQKTTKSKENKLKALNKPYKSGNKGETSPVKTNSSNKLKIGSKPAFSEQLVPKTWDNSAREQGIALHLKQSENLRLAQECILTLEEEIERLRSENEELIATADIFRERLDKMAIKNDNLKKSYEENREEFQEEKKTLMDTLKDQGQEMEKVSIKNKELEKRLSNNIQQIRVRERELENRLELMKLDSQTLVREKDQYILDLKRQIDRMKIDIETQKNKYSETEQKLKGRVSQTRRAARGMQMALHILRGNDFSLENKESEEEG